MNKVELTEQIILEKKARGLTWEGIASEIGMDTVFTTSACLGMNTLPQDAAEKLCGLLELPQEAMATLLEYPTKSWEQGIPQDPFVYRFYEVVGVYGNTLKEVIQEKFGDGIMSAIDFTMHVDKETNPNGDRVIVTLNGKFLSYKTW